MLNKPTPGPYEINKEHIKYESDGHYKSGLVIMGDSKNAAIAELCGHQPPLEAIATADLLAASWEIAKLAREVCDNWESGDLAGKIRQLDELLQTVGM